jgi:hypothetical protein
MEGLLFLKKRSKKLCPCALITWRELALTGAEPNG